MAVADDHSAPAPMTRAEYDALVRRGVLDDARVELLYGRIVSLSPQGEPHSYSVSELMTLLVRALGDRARVRVLAPLLAPNESEPEPDIAVVAPGAYLDAHPHTAHLVIEVAESSIARDRAKARLYAAARVTEYWIANINDHVIEVHREPSAEGYARITRHGRGEVLHPVAFPDIGVAVADALPPDPR